MKKLIVLSLLAILMGTLGFLPNGVQAKENPVKIGFIEDYSGDLALYGIQKLHAAKLAVKKSMKVSC